MTTIENKTVLKYRIKHLLDSKEKYERLQIQKNIVSEIQCTYNLLYHLIHLKHGEIGDIKGSVSSKYLQSIWVVPWMTYTTMYKRFVDLNLGLPGKGSRRFFEL